MCRLVLISIKQKLLAICCECIFLSTVMFSVDVVLESCFHTSAVKIDHPEHMLECFDTIPRLFMQVTLHLTARVLVVGFFGGPWLLCRF